MRINELCNLLKLELEITSGNNCYIADLKNTSILWRELWAYADNNELQGGTTKFWGRGTDPNLALEDLCEQLSNNYLVVERTENEDYVTERYWVDEITI
jgi:hypothetical protein